MKSKTYFLLAVSLSLCVSSLFANTILETQNQNIQYRFNTFNNPNIFGSDCSNKNDFISDSQFVINSITVSQYCDFLNAVAMADTYHLYDEQMASDSINASIVRSGSPNNYTYSVIDGTGDKLITFVSQISAIRYCNWIQNGQLNGKEGVASCENGTYTLNENGIIDINLNSNYFLRNENRETFLTIPFSTSNLIANKYPNHNFCMVEKINSPLPQMQMNSAELTVQEVEKGLKRVISEDKLLPSAEANISNIASIGRSRENHTSFSSIPAATSSSIAEEESDEVADDLTEENYSMSQFVEDTVVVVQDRINVYTEAIASIDQAEKIKKDFIVRALDFINESESVPEDLNKKLQNIITVPATGDIEPIVVSEVQGLKVLKKESTVSISPKDQKEEVVAALAFKKELSKFQNKVNVEEILTPAQHQLIQASLEKCERRQREVRTATAEVMERAREAREQVQRDHRKATALYEDEKQCWWPPSKNAKRSEAEACEKSIVLKRTEAEALETVYASFIKSSDYLGKAIELLTQGNKDRANFWIMKANVEEVKICATKPCDDNWKVKRDRANELVTMIRNKVWPTVSQAMKAFKNHPSIERMGIVREVASASASAYACAFAFASASSFVSSDAYANAYASAYVSAHAHASVSDFAFDPAFIVAFSFLSSYASASDAAFAATSVSAQHYSCAYTKNSASICADEYYSEYSSAYACACACSSVSAFALVRSLASAASAATVFEAVAAEEVVEAILEVSTFVDAKVQENIKASIFIEAELKEDTYAAAAIKEHCNWSIIAAHEVAEFVRSVEKFKAEQEPSSAILLPEWKVRARRTFFQALKANNESLWKDAGVAAKEASSYCHRLMGDIEAGRDFQEMSFEEAIRQREQWKKKATIAEIKALEKSTIADKYAYRYESEKIKRATVIKMARENIGSPVSQTMQKFMAHPSEVTMTEIRNSYISAMSTAEAEEALESAKIFEKVSTNAEAVCGRYGDSNTNIDWSIIVTRYVVEFTRAIEDFKKKQEVNAVVAKIGKR